MKEIKKIENHRRWYDYKPEIRKALDDIAEVNKEIGGVYDIKTIPYSYVVTVREICDMLNDYVKGASLAFAVEWANGVIDHVNSYIEYMNEPIVKVKFIDGNHIGEVKEVKESVAELLVKCKIALMI